jgi:hypothetical protein
MVVETVVKWGLAGWWWSGEEKGVKKMAGEEHGQSNDCHQEAKK